MRLRFRPEARTDLRTIIDKISEDDPAAAARMLDRLEHRWQLLLAYPYSGVARDDIESGMRHAVVAPYLILYRVAGGEIEIVRVLHGRRKMDPKSMAE